MGSNNDFMVVKYTLNLTFDGSIRILLQFTFNPLNLEQPYLQMEVLLKEEVFKEALTMLE